MIFAYYSCLLEALKQLAIIETDGLLSTECEVGVSEPLGMPAPAPGIYIF